MIVRELLTKIGFQIDKKPLVSFDKTVESTKKNLGDLSKKTNTFSFSLLGIASSLAAVQTALFAFTAATARGIEETQQLAKRAGTSSQNLQELEAVAQSAGVKTNEFTNSMISLNKAMGNARFGIGTTARDFIRLGVNVRNANGTFKDNADLYIEVANKIKALKSPSKELIYSQKLLGTSSLKLVDTFSQSAKALRAQRDEVKKLITVVDDKGIQTTNRFLSAWDKFRLMFKGVRDSIALGLMPVFTEMLEGVKDWYLGNKQVIDQNIKGVIDGLTFSLRALKEVFSILLIPVQLLVSALGGAENAIVFLTGALAVGLIPSILVAVHRLNLLRIALLSNPLTAVAIAIGLIVNEIYNWVKGNETLIEKVLGSWEDFSGMFKDIFFGMVDSTTGYFYDKFGALSEWWDGLFKSSKKLEVEFIDPKTGKIEKRLESVDGNNAKKLTNFEVSDKYKLAKIEDRKQIITGEAAALQNKQQNQLDKANFGEPEQPTQLARKLPAPFLTPSSNQITNSATNNKTYFNQSITENVTINVPAGTTEDQARAIKQIVSEQVGEELRYTMIRANTALGVN